MRLLRVNPEVQRNIWESITVTKLVVMPVVLLLIFMIMDESVRIYRGAMVLFYVITVIWGSYVAGEAVPNEVQDKTWDWQRMSAMSPWQLTWGKLFGSTFYMWYGGVFCLIMLFLAALDLKYEVWEVLQIMLSLVFVATFFQSFSMLLGIGTRDMSVRLRRFLVILVILGLSGYLMGVLAVYYLLENRDLIGGTGHKFKWFFAELPLTTHVLMTLIFLNVWSWVGLYRSVRTQMYYFNSPHFFAYFLIGIPLYFSGYLVNMKNFSLDGYFLLLFSGIVLFSNAVALWSILLDRVEFISIRRLLYYMRLGQYQKAGYDVPLWGVGFFVQVFASLLAIGVLILNRDKQVLGLNMKELFGPYLYFLLAIDFYALRDLGLVLWCHFTQGRNSVGLAITYLFILYFLLPSLFMMVSGNAPSIQIMFYPFPSAGVVDNWSGGLMAGGILSVLIQSGIVMFLVWRAWREKEAKIQTSVVSG